MATTTTASSALTSESERDDTLEQGEDYDGAVSSSSSSEGEDQPPHDDEEEKEGSGSPPTTVEYNLFLSKPPLQQQLPLPPEPATPSVADVIMLRYHLSPQMIEEKSDSELFNFVLPSPTPKKPKAQEEFITQLDQSADSSASSADITPLKYHLTNICTIGKGTFGRVQLARHKQTGHYYALKCMYIPSIVAKRQVEHVHHEKRILEMLDHPFIVKIYDTAKDSSHLYMIMEFLAGGELFSYLRMSKRFDSPVAKFYTAEIVTALEYLHGMSIAYRDLKPENLMLTQDGHIKLTDLGFAKRIDTKSYTLCGTPAYLAPEVAHRKGHNHTVDFWALGILIFELMAGRPPFGEGDDVQEAIEAMEAKGHVVEFPRRTFSNNSKDIIERLLIVDPKKRLGSQSIEEVKQHQWFKHCDWASVYNCALRPPLIPTIHYEGDIGNFDSYDEAEKPLAAKQRDLDLFDEW